MIENLIIAVLAYGIDRVFGEFGFRHPIEYIGDVIKFFEKYLYKDSVLNGFVFVVAVLVSVGGVAIAFYQYLELMHPLFKVLFESIIASMFISHKMLKDEVLKVVELSTLQEQKQQVATLVSRDVEPMTQSDVYKAAIETYAENLSDGVVAPLFYLVLFGLPGIIIYKTINTLDSMVGYRNERYEKFGKVAAKLDDIANYIPSRLTAMMLLFSVKDRSIFSYYEYGKLHKSPNAGHPISAMALRLGIKLGGDTYYFGKLVKKPFFGEGREEITKEDVQRALKMI